MIFLSLIKSPLSTLLVILALPGFCLAQEQRQKWPCEYLPALLLDTQGNPVCLSPDELEKRVVQKPEVKVPGNGCVWRDTIITVDVLINAEGRVVCTKVKKGKAHPLYLSSALMAAEKWTFKPVIENGKPVAVCGKLKFFLKQNSGLGGSSRKRPPVIN